MKYTLKNKLQNNILWKKKIDQLFKENEKTSNRSIIFHIILQINSAKYYLPLITMEYAKCLKRHKELQYLLPEK